MCFCVLVLGSQEMHRKTWAKETSNKTNMFYILHIAQNTCQYFPYHPLLFYSAPLKKWQVTLPFLLRRGEADSTTHQWCTPGIDNQTHCVWSLHLHGFRSEMTSCWVRWVATRITTQLQCQVYESARTIRNMPNRVSRNPILHVGLSSKVEGVQNEYFRHNFKTQRNKFNKPLFFFVLRGDCSSMFPAPLYLESSQLACHKPATTKIPVPVE